MTIEKINAWFRLAMPVPTKANQRVQFGVHAEEFLEGLEATKEGTPDSKYKTLVEHTQNSIKQYATTLKNNKDFDLVVTDRKELLDGLCDVIVTAVGTAHVFGFDLLGALEEVNNSNHSKFVNGKPVFNDNGKIDKGPDFFRPNLDRFLGVDPTK